MMSPKHFQVGIFQGWGVVKNFSTQEDRNFLSSSGHVMFSATFYVLQGSYEKLQPFLRTFQGLFKGHIWVSRTTYFVEILEGWVGRGVISSLQIWKIHGGGGGGVLGENLSVVGYGYFLEPHIYDLYSILDNQKAFKTTFHATTFKVEENSRLAQKLKDFSRKNGIQGLFKDYS